MCKFVLLENQSKFQDFHKEAKFDFLKFDRFWVSHNLN